ncbi:MAG: hypothetical protein VX627_00970 [Candidatus Thermoplasmatota archaeon]|nr:hypothetical protein [Candidatus Thermoplasmatota archaeon]
MPSGEMGDCPICGEHKPLEVWHRPLPYEDQMLTKACSGCYITHLWAFRDYDSD